MNKLNLRVLNSPAPVATPTGALKSVKNLSVQGLSLVLQLTEGYDSLWLEPRQVVQVPDSQISQQMKNLHRRRLINIS